MFGKNYLQEKNLQYSVDLFKVANIYKSKCFQIFFLRCLIFQGVKTFRWFLRTKFLLQGFCFGSLFFQSVVKKNNWLWLQLKILKKSQIFLLSLVLVGKTSANFRCRLTPFVSFYCFDLYPFFLFLNFQTIPLKELEKALGSFFLQTSGGFLHIFEAIKN